MRFTVTWTEDAECALARIWLAADARRAVAEASDHIDHELRRHADTSGEERFAGKRIFFVPPLAVFYDISTEDRIATVFDVWQYPSKDPDV